MKKKGKQHNLKKRFTGLKAAEKHTRTCRSIQRHH